ncbi:DUF2252 domain-containing protein [Pendulispora brunnea]|uniref:DUF2252 domain-containing protein n=2 Tax=Pendulispora brunnea TaxID=2905690 RepID=A0ABZ2KGW8_9BACT
MKMAKCVQAFVRGSPERFSEWFDTAANRNVPVGPQIWICGDCHVGNIGPLGDASQHVSVEVRDVDQTVIGNPSHDVLRLALSLAMAARESDLPGVTTARIVEQLISGYVAAVSRGHRDDGTAARKPESIQFGFKRALRRTWKDLFEERLEDTSPTIPRGVHFWPLLQEEKSAIETLFATEDVRKLVALPPECAEVARVRVVDAAFWRKGCSSLGRLRMAVLVRIDPPPKGKEKLSLIDIKEAAKPCAPRYELAQMPRSNAERVVRGATSITPPLGARMLAARLLDHSVVLREVLPQDLKFDFGRLSQDEARKIAHYLGFIVGRAHARQMGDSEREAWCRELGRHPKSIDVPSWLWTSVVELAALHEAAYLEHCRRYALESRG